MIRGLYSGAASVNAYERRHESFASNLANLATPGYRRRIEALTSFEVKNLRSSGSGLQIPRFNQRIDFTPGEIKPTENPFDLALVDPAGNDGNAFFSIAGERGEELYTRNGRLAVDHEGRLVHASSGYPVLSINGAFLQLNPAGGTPVVDPMGNVTQGEENLGQLKVVGFQRLHGLRPVEDGLFETDPDNEAQTITGRIEVRQGFYESSNTNAINELVKMITNFRAYEATQRVIRQMDQSLQRLIRQSQ